jgi:hypothetical protein
LVHRALRPLDELIPPLPGKIKPRPNLANQVRGDIVWMMLMV